MRISVMLLSLEGPNATAKTTTAYTAPLPIRGFAFDMGIERALYGAKHDELFKGLGIHIVQYDPGAVEVQPIPEGADIVIYELPAPIQLDNLMMAGMKDLWNYFIIRVGAALTDPTVRSIVVDTMTAARRIKADAFLEGIQAKPKQGEPPRVRLLQIEYGVPNDAIRDLYTTSQGVRKNLIATHHLTDERKDGVDKDGRIVLGMLTGNKVLEGLAKTHDLVDVALRMEKTDAHQIKGKFMKCGYNLSLEGTSVESPTWDSLMDQIESFTGDRLKLERRATHG